MVREAEVTSEHRCKETSLAKEMTSAKALRVNLACSGNGKETSGMEMNEEERLKRWR